MTLISLSAVIFMVSVVGLNIQGLNTQDTRKLHDAIAIIRGRNGERGELRFRDNENHKVNIRGTIDGLQKGRHGIHIHEFGDLSLGCDTAGGHFDAHRNKTPHGSMLDNNPYTGHTGDFGNVVAGDTGVANIHIDDSFVQLHGDASIVGSTHT